MRTVPTEVPLREETAAAQGTIPEGKTNVGLELLDRARPDYCLPVTAELGGGPKGLSFAS